MKLRKLALSVSLGLLMASGLPGLALASSTPRFYFSQSNVSAPDGSSVRLALHIDPRGSSLDTVSVVVHYPATSLKFNRLDNAGSYFDAVVPSMPTAQNGILAFSAASLSHGATTDDQLVANLIFTAQASSGSTTISLDGSQAAKNGSALDAETTPMLVSFNATGSSASGFKLSGFTVTDITVNSGIVHWHTSVPASSSVSYGQNAHYGFSAGSSQLVTDHSVQLATVFAGRATVHYAVQSVAADGTSASAADQSFTTRGYSVTITVHDKHAKPVAGADISVAGSQPVATNSSGVVKLSNIAPGNQKVVIAGGKTQFIAVKALSGGDATTTQAYTLSAEHTFISGQVVTGMVLLAALAIVVGLRLRRKQVHDQAN